MDCSDVGSQEQKRGFMRSYFAKKKTGNPDGIDT